MNSFATRFGVCVFTVLLLVVAAMSKTIVDQSEPEPFRKNQIDFSGNLGDDASSDTELFKYLLTKELLSRHGNAFDWDERQRKRSYWKQCAFNAVSCFGKKK